MDAPKNVEVWRNTANGPRWYVTYDVHGRESSKVVPPNRTFTLTVFERQINQEKAASPELDLFRNGTFLLQKPSEETSEHEITSPNALTDQELEELALNLTQGHDEVESVLERITTPNTLHRLMEQLVAEGADEEILAPVREKYHETEGSVVARRGPHAVTQPTEEPATA